MKEVILAVFLDAQHFLDLRLGLEHEVFWTAAAPEHHGALAAGPLGGEDDGGGFIHVNRGVHAQFVAAQFHTRHVHANGRVAGRTSVAWHPGTIGGGEHGHVLEAGLAFPFGAVFADEMVQFGGAHFLLKLGLDENVAEDFVGGHQAIAVAEQHVIDADDVVLAQLGVVKLEVADAHRIIQREVHVVIEIGAGGHNPVHETGLDERHDGRATHARWRERAGEAHADGDIRSEHFLREELAAFLEPRAVVGEKGFVHQVGELFLAGDVLG